MKHFLITLGIGFAFVLSSKATSVELPITPTNLDDYSYSFSVQTNETKDGVVFHVTITNKQFSIFSDSSADLELVRHKKLADGGLEISVVPVTPAIPVALKKEKRFWNAYFTVSRKLVKDSDVYFVFRVFAHSTVNGKIVGMPSVTFYELRLQDFAKPAA